MSGLSETILDGCDVRIEHDTIGVRISVKKGDWVSSRFVAMEIIALTSWDVVDTQIGTIHRHLREKTGAKHGKPTIPEFQQPAAGTIAALASR